MTSATPNSSELWRSFVQASPEDSFQSTLSPEVANEDLTAFDSLQETALLVNCGASSYGALEAVDKLQVIHKVPSDAATPKRIIVCCDGTWQSSITSRKNIPSNVTRLRQAISGTAKVERDGKDVVCHQIVHYISGVGTGDGVSIFERGRQSAFGSGLDDDVINAYDFIVNNYAPHDEIFCFGFSRGAYTARAVAGLITDIGIILPEEMTDFPELYGLYKKSAHDDSFNFRYSPEYRKWITGVGGAPHKFPPEFTRVVQVVGVFDTVGSLGIPGTDGVVNHILNKIPFSGVDDVGFHNLSLSRYIKHAYHALALDERGTSFTPTLWRLPRNDQQHPPCGNKKAKQLVKELRKLLVGNATEKQLSDAWRALIEREMWNHLQEKEMSVQLKKENIDLEQVWFPGSHLNIGGGNPSILYGYPFDCEQLALIPFTWMCDQIKPFLQLNDERILKDAKGRKPTLSTLADREVKARESLIEYTTQINGYNIKSAVQIVRKALDYTGLYKDEGANRAWALGPIIDMLPWPRSFPYVFQHRTPGAYKKDHAENDTGLTNERIHPSVRYRKEKDPSYKPGSLEGFAWIELMREARKCQLQHMYDWAKGSVIIPEFVIRPENFISRQLASYSREGKEFVTGRLKDYRKINAACDSDTEA